jgi:hypothetical protein
MDGSRDYTEARGSRKHRNPRGLVSRETTM